MVCFRPICLFVAALAVVLTVGCALKSWFRTEETVFEPRRVRNGMLEIEGDFRTDGLLPLLDELQTTHQDMKEILHLPDPKDVTLIRVFNDDYSLNEAIHEKMDVLPSRRTYFFETTRLEQGQKVRQMEILVKYTDCIADDLRHESAHGYLHSVCHRIPLWLDEGLAEYFEPQRTVQGVQGRHINRLMLRKNSTGWLPDLARLEQLEKTVQYDMTIEDYAESWLWVHFLLNYAPQTRALLQNYLNTLDSWRSPRPMSEQIAELYPNNSQLVRDYLVQLNRTLCAITGESPLPSGNPNQENPPDSSPFPENSPSIPLDDRRQLD